MTAVAVVSAPIPLAETGSALTAFKMSYQQLFEEFKGKLVAEYTDMRCSYMNEYQSNYEANTSRTQDRITEANESIASKEE